MSTQKLIHVPYVKTQAEEVSLLETGSFSAQRQYILWYGFQSRQGQIMFADSGFSELIRMQNLFYGQWWFSEARQILCRRGLLSPLSEEDEQQQKRAFKNWLYNCLHAPRDNEAAYGRMQLYGMAGDEIVISAVGEEEQLRWLDEKNIEKISSYTGRWKGKAAVRFLQEAPEESVFFQLHYRLLKRPEEQYALAQRDISNGENNLIWFYFSSYRAFPEVQALLRDYDANLWNRMVMVNYGWDFEFERKFGSLKAWQEKLSENYSLLAHCPIENIRQVLHGIE